MILNLDITFLVSAIAGLLIVIVSFLVLLASWRAKSNWIFLLMSMAVAGWIVTVLFRFYSEDAAIVLISARLTFMCAAMIAFFLYFFTWFFPVPKRKIGVFNVLIGLVSIVSIFFSASSYTVQSIQIVGGVQSDTYGVGYYLFGAYFWALLMLSVYNLLSKYKNLNQVERTQVQYMLLGFITSMAVGFATNVVLPYVTGTTNLAKLGPASSVFFIMLTSIAILKYHMFKIRVIATELLMFILWVGLLVNIILPGIINTFFLNVVMFVAIIFAGIFIIRATINDVKRETREKEKEIQHRKEVEKLAKELEIANKRQEDLLHLMNHDVKKPLSRDINVFASILDGSLGALPLQMKELVEEGLKLTRIDIKKIVDFLNDANLKTGEVKYASVPFDLRRVIESAVQGMKEELASANIQLKIEAENDKTYLVKGDEEKFSNHILGNLFKNLTTYARGASAVLSLVERNGKILLSLKDYGVGITPDDMKNLFTKGGKGTKSAEINKESTGEGLYDAKMTTEIHGGKIWAESEGTGKGSTFFVELPIV